MPAEAGGKRSLSLPPDYYAFMLAFFFDPEDGNIFLQNTVQFRSIGPYCPEDPYYSSPP
jgi:hypothetical protein